MDGLVENLCKCWIVIPDQIRGTSGDALVGKVIRIPDNDRCANLEICLKESFWKCI
jgi:hypothetical protein